MSADTQNFAILFQGVEFAMYGWNTYKVDTTSLIWSYISKERFSTTYRHSLGKTTARVWIGKKGSTKSTGKNIGIGETSKGDTESPQCRVGTMSSGGKKQWDQGPCIKYLLNSLIPTANLIKWWDGSSRQANVKKTRPHMVIQKITPTSYEIRRLPFTEGAGCPGKTRKTNAQFIEWLPSTLCIKKR